MANIDDYEDMMHRIKSFTQRPIYPNSEIIDRYNQMMANSAVEAFRNQQELDEQLQEIAERNAMRDNAIQRTAQESIVHTRLLEKQLQEV